MIFGADVSEAKRINEEKELRCTAYMETSISC
jgi:hypothetical protein